MTAWLGADDNWDRYFCRGKENHLDWERQIMVAGNRL